MKIFIDFDDTIFNTKKFKEDLLGIYYEFGISKEEFDKTYYMHSKETGLKKFDPLAQIKKLEKIKGVSLASLKERVDDFLKDLKGYVFEDFYSFAKSFEKQELVLLSFGEKSFQKTKIKGARIEDFFSFIELTDQRKGPGINRLVERFKAKGEPLFFLDDRPDQLKEVGETVPGIIPVRIKREEGRYYAMRNECHCEEMSDLNAAGALVRRMR